MVRCFAIKNLTYHVGDNIYEVLAKTKKAIIEEKIPIIALFIIIIIIIIDSGTMSILHCRYNDRDNYWLTL